MYKRANSILKWTMFFILLTQQIYFLPADLGSYPFVFYELIFVEGIFDGEIFSILLILGQLAGIAALFSESISKTTLIGKISTVLLIISNIGILILIKYPLGAYVFFTALPFIISLILFWYFSFIYRRREINEI